MFEYKKSDQIDQGATVSQNAKVLADCLVKKHSDYDRADRNLTNIVASNALSLYSNNLEQIDDVQKKA